MAEQEACTELVEKASQDQIGTTFEGESQLLPLLQGLLEAPDNEQTADSGTESGEDQRSGLIAEVQNALDKLSTNLRDDSTDITPERRTSLLQLVGKLQAGLAASVLAPERRSSVQGRFRRRQRPNRHTVGVSSEELADARRLIEEISLHDLTPQTSRSKLSVLQKQNSEGSVGQNSSPSFKPFSPQKSVVKNAVAKPFSSSNSTVSGNSSSVQTPTEPSESLDFLFNEEVVEKKPDFSNRSISMDEQNILRSSSGDVSLKLVQHAIKQAAARKSTENLLESEETDEDSTVKGLNIKTEETNQSVLEHYKELPQPDVVMQSNPIYLQQKSITNEEKINKFNSKKIKMKRANTIDIPKPLNFYEDEDEDSDCSLPEEDYQQRRRSNYLALRGPIRVGNSGNKRNTVPVFEAKTDNDKKFLAFINKHNEDNSARNTPSKKSLWSKPETNQGNVWNNKFGNIKTAFEKSSTDGIQSQNSARQFWKSADDAITSVPKYDGPKISKQSARNLRQMFEEKQQQAQKSPWSTSTQTDKNIVTGSLKVKAFEPHNEKTYKFVPQPLPVNKFSHAPQSAFKPIPKKAPPPNLQISKAPLKNNEKSKDLDSPLYLYSPKPSNEPSLKPWVTSPSESRVLSLAASKFENIAPQEPVPIKPRKLSKDKITLPFQQQTSEKLSAPYLVKSVEQKNNFVRQLSGQYDNVGEKNNDAYATYSTVKYISPQADKATIYHQQYKQIPQQQYPQLQAEGAPIYRHQYKSDQGYKQLSQQPFHSPQFERNSSSQQQYKSSQDYKQIPRQQYTSTQTGTTSNYHQKYTPNQEYKVMPQQQYSVSSKQNQQHQDDKEVSRQNINQNQYSVTSEQYKSPQQYDQIPLHHDNHYLVPSQQHYQQDYQQAYQNQQHPASQIQQYSYSQNQIPNSAFSYPNQPYASRSDSYESVNETPRSQNHHTEPPKQVHIPENEQKPQYEPHIMTDQDYTHKTKPTTEQDYNYEKKSQQQNEPQYTSTYQYQPQIQTPSPNHKQKSSDQERQEPKKEINETQIHPTKYESQNLKEYNAVSSRVMTGPVSQQATTVRQKSPMNRDEHEIAAALSLRTALQKVSPKPETSPLKMSDNDSRKNSYSRDDSPSVISPITRPNYKTKESQRNASPVSYNYRSEETSPSGITSTNYRSNDGSLALTSSNNTRHRDEPPKIMSPVNYNYKSREPAPRIISPNSFSYRPRDETPKPVSPHSFSYKSREAVSSNNYYRSRKQPAPVESLEINDNGESIVTSKFQIPVINVPQPESPRPPSNAQISNKAESWNQICMQNQLPLHKPSPRASPNARTVSKSKSSHSLALPKQFEAGMSKDEIAEKRKTMEAFLGSGSKSPQSLSWTSSNDNLSSKSENKVVKRSINRLKTSEKVSSYRHSSGLSRSRTLPDIVCPDLLDETNVDKAFEDLFKSST